jgi:hypothetical protein
VDVISTALSMVAVLPAIYGLKLIARDGLGWLSAFSIATGLALSVIFVRRQTRLADPLIDMRLFKVPAFSVSLAAYALATFVVFGTSVFIAQYMQLVLGLSPWRAGLWTTPLAAAFIVGALLTPMIARRVGPARVMVGGLALAAVGFAVLTQVGGPASLAVLVSGFVVYALGLAPVFTLATDLIVGSAPPERAGLAAAISETGSEFGGALGIAILGSIGTAVYRGGLADVIPRSIPLEAAMAARDTLAGAVAVAGQLPSQIGVELLGVARTAFTQAIEVTAICSAVIVLAMAIVAALLLQRAGEADQAGALDRYAAESLGAKTPVCKRPPACRSISFQSSPVRRHTSVTMSRGQLTAKESSEISSVTMATSACREITMSSTITDRAEQDVTAAIHWSRSVISNDALSMARIAENSSSRSAAHAGPSHAPTAFANWCSNASIVCSRVVAIIRSAPQLIRVPAFLTLLRP